MQNLPTLRLHARELVRTEAYAELDRYFIELETQWREAQNGSHPYIECTNPRLLFDFSTVPYETIAGFLQAWIAACPEAYHPRLVWGKFCFRRAASIRGSGCADGVTQDRWLGASLACESAAAALLEAMERSPRPISAGIAMMEMSAHFHEPGWLLDLYRGVAPRATADTGLDEALVEAAHAHLATCAIPPLQHVPQALPSALPPRDAHEMDQGEDYWLHRVLEWRPACLEGLLGYTHYLRPRWGGSYEDIEGLASGPLADGLNEAQRNAIRWTGVFDAISDYPEVGEVSTAQAFQRRFEAWLERDLRPEERGDALGRFANFCSYSLKDSQRAHQLHVASVAAFPASHYFREVYGPFHNFAYLTIIQHLPDQDGAFKTALERMCLMDEQSTPLALAAVAHQFGRWGFEQDPQRAQQLLERAVQLGLEQIDDDFNMMSAATMLWHGGDYEQSFFLTQQLAERNVPEAANHLYDIHRGVHDNTPERYLDTAARDHWLQRGVDQGSPQARYYLAWRKLFNEPLDFSDRSNVRFVRHLLEDARKDPDLDSSARLRIGVLLRDHGTREEQQEGVQGYLRSLIDDEDDWQAARACAEIALAYMHGHGARKSRFAAIEWARHATRLLPEDEGIAEIESQVLNSHSLIKTMGTVLGAFLGKGNITAADLPPKPAP